MNDSYDDYHYNSNDNKQESSYSLTVSTDRKQKYDLNMYDRQINNRQESEDKMYSIKAQVDDNKMMQLEKDKNYLLQKNKDLEDNISRLERIIDTQFTIASPNKTTISTTCPNVNYTSIMSTVTNYPTKNTTISNRKKSPSRSKSKPKLKKRILTPKRPTSKSKVKVIWSNEKEKEEKEANALRLKVLTMEKKIKQLTEEVQLNALENKGESYLLYEVDKWQKRTDIIGKDYIENLALIKKKLYNDKIDYQNEIKKIQNVCAYQISKLKENCDDVINKQNYTIDTLVKHNDDLRKRLDKLKNVFVK